MKKLKKTYQTSKLLQDASQLQRQLNNSVNGELTDYELESVTAHYVKRESEPGLDFLRLLLFLMFVPLLMGIMFLSLLMVGFVMLVMSVKDLVVGLTPSWLVHYFRGRKKVQVQ